MCFFREAQSASRSASASAAVQAALRSFRCKQTQRCRQRLARELEQLPWSRKDKRYFLSREEEYVGGLRAATQIWQRMSSGEYTVDDALLVRAMVDWPGGLELHIGVRFWPLPHCGC